MKVNTNNYARGTVTTYQGEQGQGGAAIAQGDNGKGAAFAVKGEKGAAAGFAVKGEKGAAAGFAVKGENGAAAGLVAQGEKGTVKAGFVKADGVSQAAIEAEGEAGQLAAYRYADANGAATVARADTKTGWATHQSVRDADSYEGSTAFDNLAGKGYSGSIETSIQAGEGGTVKIDITDPEGQQLQKELELKRLGKLRS